MNETPFISTSTGPHRGFAMMIGEWQGLARTWFEPNTLSDESLWSGQISPVLEGRFLLHEYQGSIQGEPLRGMMIIGYSLEKEQYETTWIDQFHMGTAILYSEGQSVENGFSVRGNWFETYSKQFWGWRTQFSQSSASELLIQMYNITPSGEEALGVEVHYHRK